MYTRKILPIFVIGIWCLIALPYVASAATFVRLSQEATSSQTHRAYTLMAAAAYSFSDFLVDTLCPLLPFVSCEPKRSLEEELDATALVQPKLPTAPLSTATATTVIERIVVERQPVVTQPVVERTVERVVREPSVPITSGVSEQFVFQRRQELDNKLSTQIQQVSASAASVSAPQIQLIGHATKIDQLGAITITGPAISGGSITNATISGGSVTATGFSGVLPIESGGTGTSTAPTYGKLLLGNSSGTYDLVATSSLGISGASGSGTVNSGTANALAFYPSTGAAVDDSDFLFVDDTNNRLGVGTTSPYAKLSVAGEIVGAYFTGTATATSTLAGGLQTAALNVTSTAASSTFANGINLSAGCFSINGTCLGSGAVMSVSNSDSTLTISPTTGAVVASLNLGNSNTWTVLQKFYGHASSTLFSAHRAYFGATATSSFDSAGALTLAGGLNGPLQANSGIVSATTSVGPLYGGTGQTSYSAGDILYASAANTLSKLPIGSSGQVLKVSGGAPTWGADATSGGGSGVWSTTTDSLAAYPTGTSDVILIGASATSTTGNIFEVLGASLLRGALTAYNTITAPTFTATSTLAASTLPYASSTAITVSGAASTSNLIASNTFTLGNLTGFLKATAGSVATALINLASDVTGILPVSNGGTGWAALQANTLLLGNGTGAIATTSQGANGQVLALVNGVPTWQATTTLSTIAGTLNATQLDGVFSSNGILARTGSASYTSRTLTGATNQIIIANGDGVSANPTFSLPSLLSISQASSTIQSILDGVYVGRTSTTTILASATSTFGAGVQATALNVTSSTASSTFVNGINLSAGCFAVNGTCVGSSTSNFSIEDLADVAGMTKNYGDLLFWNGSTWTDLATSSLAIALSDTTGTLGVARGGTNATSQTTNGVNYFNGTSITSGTGLTFDGTKLGVGTTSPYAKLSVVGEIVGAYFTGTTTATSTLGGGLQTTALNVISSTASSTFGNGINLSAGCFAITGTCIGGGSSSAAGGTGAVQFANGTSFAGDATNFFWNDSLDGLGLGTSTPQWTLQLASSTKSQLTLTDPSAGSNLKHWSLRSAGGNLYFATSTDSTFATSSATALTINSSGNVGIGTSSPAAKLSIQDGNLYLAGQGGGGINSFTKLLLHTDGTDGSTTFTDSSLSPKTISVFGNAQVDTAQSKFGGASALFDGTGDYLTGSSADFAFGTNDFTIDFWMRRGTQAGTANYGKGLSR